VTEATRVLYEDQLTQEGEVAIPSNVVWPMGATTLHFLIFCRIQRIARLPSRGLRWKAGDFTGNRWALSSGSLRLAGQFSPV
jgi:hypothetical protein